MIPSIFVCMYVWDEIKSLFSLLLSVTTSRWMDGWRDSMLPDGIGDIMQMTGWIPTAWRVDTSLTDTLIPYLI